MALLPIKSMALLRIGRPCQEREVPDPRPGGFTVFGDMVSQPVDIGAKSLHFTTAGIQPLPVQASFDTIIDSFINIFHGPTTFPEFRVGGKYSAVIVAIQAGTSLQMAVLAIHSIGKGGNGPPGPEIPGCAGYQVLPVPAHIAFRPGTNVATARALPGDPPAPLSTHFFSLFLH